MKLTEKQYKLFLKTRLDTKINYLGGVENKYHNKKVEYNGIKFDSIKEMRHYVALKELEKLGYIKDLQLQVKFELQPSFKYNNATIRAITYIADFVYYNVQENKTIVVDVKGFKTKEYLLKKKMFMFKYQDYKFIEI